MALASVSNKIRGCIVGGALGDAVGLFTEFLNASQARDLYGSHPRLKLRPPAPEGWKTMHMDRHRAMFEEAAWTDDTDQSLCILMSFLHSGGKQDTDIDYNDFAKRLKHWVAFGFRPLDRLPLGLGRTVGSVVNDPSFVEDPIGTSTLIWERGNRRMAANGAIMRTPVIGTLLFKNQERLYSSAINIAATTHADPRCLVSCTIASALVASIIRDEIHSDADIRNTIEAAILPVTSRDPPLPEEQIEEMRSLIWKDQLSDMELDGRSSIGYTYKCLASGVWALRQGVAAIKEGRNDGASVFERVITELTMAGGDADTNGAVAGSLLGTLLGYSNLPKGWTADLKYRDWLVSKADAATYLVTGEGAPYDYKNDTDTLFDAGKGDMSKEEMDARWKVLIETLHHRTGDTEKFAKLEADRKKREEGCVVL